jgi:hypothetical protein
MIVEMRDLIFGIILARIVLLGLSNVVASTNTPNDEITGSISNSSASIKITMNGILNE